MIGGSALSLRKTLFNKIDKRTARIAIIGLGYVGLPLAMEFVRSGFKTSGIDTNKKRIEFLQKDISYVDDISNQELRQAKQKGFQAFLDFKKLRFADCIIICITTPLSKTRQPDLSHIFAALNQVARFVHKGQLIVLESTTYPGTTDEGMRPLLEKESGWKADRDFFMGFSPERVDPGSRRFALTDIPKVVGGVGPDSSAVLKKLYESVFRKVVVVSNAKTAEMVKLL